MKMKNMLIGGMSLALVACISIGGTLAYLQDSDGTLKNTFDFVDKGITIDVWEQVGEETIGKGNETDTEAGHGYASLVSDQVLDKHVQLDYNVGTPSYLFVNIAKVGTNSQDMILGTGMATGKAAVIAEGWTALTGYVDEDGYGVYYREVGVTESTETASVFKNVTVPTIANSDNLSNITIKDIKVKAAAVQKEGFASAADAYAKVESALTINAQ